MKHILICGNRQVGKSTLIERLSEEITVPIYGFITKIMRVNDEGFHEIYIFHAADKERNLTEDKHLADCDTVRRNVNTDKFETLGVDYLRAKPGGIVIMDELGFMESGAEKFRKAVLAAFDGDIPVIAAIKKGYEDNAFLNAVKAHPNAELFEIDRENRDALYEKLLPVVKEMNSRAVKMR